MMIPEHREGIREDMRIIPGDEADTLLGFPRGWTQLSEAGWAPFDEDRAKPVKHFKPPFKAELEGDRSLATASEIFCCVVFRKALPAAGGSRFPATAGGKRPSEAATAGGKRPAEAATAGPAGPDAKKPRAAGRAPSDYSDL